MNMKGLDFKDLCQKFDNYSEATVDHGHVQNYSKFAWRIECNHEPQPLAKPGIDGLEPIDLL